MKAVELYERIERDFNLAICSDEWVMEPNEYITEQFLKRSMGLVTDCSDTISYVYTAVFPSADVISKIISDGRRDALLFVHHPMNWDITKFPVFSDVPAALLEKLRERKISIYNLHVPLDANGPYGTTANLAAALGVDATGEFYEYFGVKVGVIGTTDCGDVNALKNRFEEAVGHPVALYKYGEEEIRDGKVALIAGGGNTADVYPFLREMGINAYLTGIAAINEDFAPSVEAHEAAKAGGVNILAGSHYSTEKFACMKMVEYFAGLGIAGEFAADKPGMEDM